MPNQSLPTYVDGEFLPRKRAETKPNGTSLTLVIAAYDRAAKQRKELSHTFTNCALR